MENSDFVYVKTVKFLQVFPTLYFTEILLFSFFNLEGVCFGLVDVPLFFFVFCLNYAMMRV
jgi:hypothetical protein